MYEQSACRTDSTKYQSMEFTGERVIPSCAEAKGLWHVHLARYRFAQLWAQGKTVLDVACGTGYGSALLAQTAEAVVGIDIDHETIEYANRHYCLPNCGFATGNASHISFSDRSFDLVVSFETIEHIERPAQFVNEAHRVLRSGGILLVSTPPRSRLAGIKELLGQQHANPYHVHEFTRRQFSRLLEERFQHVVMHHQRFTNPAYYRARNLRLAAMFANKLPPRNVFREVASHLERRATQTYDWMKRASLDDISIMQDSNGEYQYLIAFCCKG